MSTIATWPSQAENWLDERGKAAWIIAMIVGFIVFWPLGLALLAYMIWSKRIFSGGCTRRHAFCSSGNSAFDAYKANTLKRLKDEQKQFEAFLNRLREAKDKSEFDRFMDERAGESKRTRTDEPPAADA